MKTAAFSDALTFLDDDLVNEVRTKRNAPCTAWMGWAAAAACLALVIYAGVKLWPTPETVTPAMPGTPGTEAVEPVTPEEPGDHTRAVEIWGSPQTDENGACYTAPKPGTCGYSVGLQEQLECWKEYDVYYGVAFDLFKEEDGALRAATEEEAAAEYRSLCEAGVRLYETPMWNYEGPEGTKVTYTAVVALFTAEELPNFPASDDYGYFFYFPRNGDGSEPECAHRNCDTPPSLTPYSW